MDDQQVRGEEGTVFDSECLAVLEECLGDLFERGLLSFVSRGGLGYLDGTVR